MKHGLIKTAAATPKIKVADCAYNAAQIIKIMEDAALQGIRLLVLPELCVTGYTCGDLFFQRTLLEGAIKALEEIKKASVGKNMLMILGAPLEHFGKLYNCACVICNGQILGVVPKKNIPNYNEFYEARQFTQATDVSSFITIGQNECPFAVKQLFYCEQLPDFCVGVELCEDLWVAKSPSTDHAAAGALLIANPSASNETIGKESYRRQLVSSQSARLVAGYVYSDAGEGESTTDVVFSGHNLIYENGVLLAESKPFGEGLAVSEMDVFRLVGERRRLTTYKAEPDGTYIKTGFSIKSELAGLTRNVSRYPFVPSNQKDRQERCELILKMQANGLKKRLEHTGAKTAVIGISGGLDSSLALLVAARAADLMQKPRTDILAVTMPCFGTTERTKNNAQRLCEQMGVSFLCVDIKESVKRHFEDIGQDGSLQDVTYENAQARERTQVLMDLANKNAGIVVGTGDLSELALGWATYNGDHMSMYGVNTSVPKTLVRHIVRYAADFSEDRELKNVLYDILDTPVSPELLPARDGEIAQRTEDIVGPYELHDFFLYYALRWGFSPSKVLLFARYAFGEEYSEKTILCWLKVFYKRFFSQQFKRSCLPDGPKIGSVSLSPRGDLRMPSDASCALWLSELKQL